MLSKPKSPDFPSLIGLAHLGPKSRVASSHSSLVTRSYRSELPVPMFLSACNALSGNVAVSILL